MERTGAKHKQTHAIPCHAHCLSQSQTRSQAQRNIDHYSNTATQSLSVYKGDKNAIIPKKLPTKIALKTLRHLSILNGSY